MYSPMIVDSQADTGQTGMNAAHLEKLNDRQRAAVEHGVGLSDGKVGGPLLIIAGAGSGKTKCLLQKEVSDFSGL